MKGYRRLPIDVERSGDGRRGRITEDRKISGPPPGTKVFLLSARGLDLDVVAESSLGFARLHGPAGDPIFSGWIARSRIDIQFNRELRLRLFGQYDDFDETLGLQPLLGYELNPFSIFFVGATLDYQGEARHALRARGHTMTPVR